MSPRRADHLLLLVLTVLSPFSGSAAEPAFVYHGALDGVRRLGPLEAKVTAEVQRLLQGAAPKLDWTLVRAARSLAQHPGSVRDVLEAQGASDAYVLPLSYRLVDASQPLAPVRSLLAGDVADAGVSHFGVGVAGTGPSRRVSMVFVRRGAALARFPKQVEAGDRYLLNGRLLRGLSHPLVLIASPQGRVLELKPRFEHGVFWTMVDFEPGTGRYQVEVQAEGPYGVEVLNLMQIYATEPGVRIEAPLVRVSPPLRPVESVQAAERRAIALINQSRDRVGLAPLATSRMLTHEARAHSADMVSAAFFGHISSRRGGLGQRLAKAGYPGLLASENIAMAPSPEWAHAELLRSPSHLRNILDPSVTHVGVGVQRRNGHGPVYVFTQIFARLGVAR